MPKRFDQKLPKDWVKRSRVFLALGDEHRQRILLMFERGKELAMKDVIDACPLSRTATTHHIRSLLDAKIITAEKRARSVYLRPNPTAVIDALQGVLTYIEEEL
jgi:DNA-binding transcriptional ArsR family regulator